MNNCATIENITFLKKQKKNINKKLKKEKFQPLTFVVKLLSNEPWSPSTKSYQKYLEGNLV